MFEEGQSLRQRFGADRVYDFSLGNPIAEPPPAFQQALRELSQEPPKGMHRYMPNNGFLSTRQAVAQFIGKREMVAVDPADVVMTIGAAGALSVVFRSILDPGDEVLILAPYFVEYLFYTRWNNGRPRIVETTADFRPSLEAIEEAIGPRTKAVVVNTPNNPTGQVYRQDEISAIAALLAAKEREFCRSIYLVSDTPYARITYDGAVNPRLLDAHSNSILVHSHSKDLGLAGERIGYLVINPRSAFRQQLREACTFNNRTLGFVNAPAMMQLALERSIEAAVDVAMYDRLRSEICAALEQAGLAVERPAGAFYLFPRTPIPDDLAFCQMLLDEQILVVPGTGFGRPGHIRVSYCVEPQTIDGAIPGFRRAVQRARTENRP
jgi:aspartate aminotransferase